MTEHKLTDTPEDYTAGERPAFLFTDEATQRQLNAMGMAVVDRLELDRWKRRAEEAERALLRTWKDVAHFGGEVFVRDCRVCHRRSWGQDPVRHTPDCIIPRLVIQYGDETNG